MTSQLPCDLTAVQPISGGINAPLNRTRPAEVRPEERAG